MSVVFGDFGVLVLDVCLCVFYVLICYSPESS